MAPGPDIWRASVRVFDAAVQRAYGGKRRLAWFEVLAGEKAKNLTGEWLPADTLEALKAYKVGIKGPLTTPIGGGIRSLNVTLRQVLDLFACVRPVRYFRRHAFARHAPRAHERHHLPREHGRRVRRHRMGKGHSAGGARHRVPGQGDGEADCARFGHRHQADVGNREQAARPDGHSIRPGQEAEGRHACPQGQHHEVHGGRVPRLGIRSGQGRIPRQNCHGRGSGARAHP